MRRAKQVRIGYVDCRVRAGVRQKHSRIHLLRLEAGGQPRQTAKGELQLCCFFFHPHKPRHFFFKGSDCTFITPRARIDAQHRQVARLIVPLGKLSPSESGEKKVEMTVTFCMGRWSLQKSYQAEAGLTSLCFAALGWQSAVSWGLAVWVEKIGAWAQVPKPHDTTTRMRSTVGNQDFS